ncbi:MAG TPA: hypothetical protein VMD29_15930, partial [Terracidiphilus sp.]|nr:hypothetical protein [Terracidiphilus sp.]
LTVAVLAAAVCSVLADAQAPARAGTEINRAFSEPGASDSQPFLPDAPEAVPFRDFAGPSPGGQSGGEPWEGNRQYGPFSRVAIGADVSPLGIGIKGATILGEYLDARMLLNFFNYDSGHFEIDTFSADAKLHLFSVGAAVDAYPRNSIWRLSAGLLMYNGNNLSMTADIVPGQNVTVDGQNYYSADPTKVPGATPLSGSGTLGLDARQPEFFVSGGFGRFIPRSERHWSFPSEFGVIFMGAPTINVNTSGWVCTDFKETNCSDISDSSSPVATEFNNSLQAEVAKWRHSASAVTIYPMFSYSVVYSFDVK